MDQNPFTAAAEQLNSGAAIPAVSASDIKQMWNATRRMKADLPMGPNTAIGIDVFAGYGVEAASTRHEQFIWIQLREMLISGLSTSGVLSDYMHGEELDEKVFCAAATIPCDKNDLAEAMAPFWFRQVPVEVGETARDEMRAAGYDPDRPRIVTKFFEWMHDHC